MAIRKIHGGSLPADKPRRARRRLTGAAPVDVEAAIADLPRVNVSELRKRWEAWFGEHPPPCQSGRVLRMLLAWRIQECRFGGPSTTAERALRDLTGAKSSKSRAMTRVLPTRGTLLSREWKGTMHRVQVLDDGFAHDGVVYASLSEIARVITGTRWSGPRFFGLDRGPRGG